MEDAPTISPKIKTTASGRSKEIKDMPVFIQLYGTHTQKNPIEKSPNDPKNKKLSV